MSAADLVHQGAGVVRLDDRMASPLRDEHIEMIGDNRVEFVVAPVFANFGLIGHGEGG